MTLNQPLAWYISPVRQEHTYIYNKLDQNYFPNGIDTSTLQKEPIDYVLIRVQNVEIIKGHLVYPLIDIKVKNLDSKAWMSYPETQYQNYDEPYIIIPLQEFDIFMITIKWNNNAFLESNTYDILVYNPSNTDILLNNDLFINLNPIKQNDFVKTNEKKSINDSKNDSTFQSYENR